MTNVNDDVSDQAALVAEIHDLIASINERLARLERQAEDINEFLRLWSGAATVVRNGARSLIDKY